MNLHILIQIIFIIVSGSAADARSVAKSTCLTKCGDVSIPHPFGIGKECYLDEWYEVTCNNIIKKPFLSKLNLEILRVYAEKYSLAVMNPVASNCQRQKGNTNFTGTPFSFDPYYNKFVVVGCDSAQLFAYYRYSYKSFEPIFDNRYLVVYGYDCLPRCEPGSSVEGCQTFLAPVPQDSYGKINFFTISVEEKTSIGCTYAFLIQASADLSSINTTDQVSVVISYNRGSNPNIFNNRNTCANCKNDCYRNQETGDYQCGNRREIILDDEFPLSWKMRLQIATEVAGALAYLHSASSVPIYHRDIKSTNILLDEKFRAKIADFGTSRSISIEQSHLTTAVYGTIGYLDPEYFQSSQFTDKSDVYSFGVVLAELLTGQKAISLSESEEERSLAARFVLYAEQMRVLDIMDARVLEEAPKEDIFALSDTTRRCLNLNGKMRPTMKEVAMDLEVMSREPVAAAPTILKQGTFNFEMGRNSLENHYSTSTMIMSDYEAFPSSETDPLIFYSQ